MPQSSVMIRSKTMFIGKKTRCVMIELATKAYSLLMGNTIPQEDIYISVTISVTCNYFKISWELYNSGV